MKNDEVRLLKGTEDDLRAAGWLLLPKNIPELGFSAVCPECRRHVIDSLTEKGADLLLMEYYTRKGGSKTRQ